MSTKPPLLLYSTNSSIAYMITKDYYNDRHYVWCSTIFNFEDTPRYVPYPPSSCPEKIYIEYMKAIRNTDRHCSKIMENKNGIIKGAEAKKTSGVITDNQYNEILDIVDQSELQLYKPLLYVIPCHLVSNMVESVSINTRANPLFAEYLIRELPRDYFDILTFDNYNF